MLYYSCKFVVVDVVIVVVVVVVVVVVLVSVVIPDVVVPFTAISTDERRDVTSSVARAFVPVFESTSSS